MTEEAKPKTRTRTRKPTATPAVQTTLWQRIASGVCLRAWAGFIGWIVFLVMAFLNIDKELAEMIGLMSLALMGLPMLDKFTGGKK